MKLEYGSIGASFTFRASLRDLSGREQVDLCRQLMEQLGILDAFSAEPDATARAQVLVTEAWQRAWDAGSST